MSHGVLSQQAQEFLRSVPDPFRFLRAGSGNETRRDPASLTVAELKLWLQERKKSTKGKKADLVARLVNLIQ